MRSTEPQRWRWYLGVAVVLAAAGCSDAPVAPTEGAVPAAAPRSAVEAGGLPTTWYIRQDDGALRAVQLGVETDVAVPGDHDGDGVADAAVFRPSTGWWYIQPADGSPAYDGPFGSPGDIPVPADYSGDGRMDLGVFRPATGYWYLLHAGSGTTVILPFGLADDVPVPADYDGDGRADVAVYRPSTRTWYIQRSSNQAVAIVPWGADGDVPVPADYDGDGVAELGVFRAGAPAQWWIYDLQSGTYGLRQWGTTGDVPVPGDYDGDGMADAAIYRPGSSQWWVLQSTDQQAAQLTWGLPGDEAVPARYLDGARTRAAVRRAGLLPQSIDFTLPVLRTLGAPLALTASGGGSGNPVQFASETPATCTVSGSTMTPVAVGDCTITATQAGGGPYDAAEPVSRTMSIVYPFAFGPPLLLKPELNVASAGGTLKLSFNLGAGYGLDILADGWPKSTEVACTAPFGAVGDPVAAQGSGKGLTFKSGLYTYAWKTEKAWRGTCRELELKLADGLTRAVVFRFE